MIKLSLMLKQFIYVNPNHIIAFHSTTETIIRNGEAQWVKKTIVQLPTNKIYVLETTEQILELINPCDPN